MHGSQTGIADADPRTGKGRLAASVPRRGRYIVTMPSVAAVATASPRRARRPKRLLTADELLDWLESVVNADLIDGIVQMRSLRQPAPPRRRA